MKKKEEKDKGDINPFSALFSFLIPEKKEEKEKIIKEYKKNKKLKSDNYAEGYIRNCAEAMNLCFTIYDKYKKAHGMETFPYVGDEEEAALPMSPAEKFFVFK